MAEHPHKAPAHPSGHSARRITPWRVGTPLVILVCGALFVVSAENSEGTDLRPGRYTDLATLTGSEFNRYQTLEQRVAKTDKEVSRLTQEVDDTTVRRYKGELDALKDPAGLVAHTGQGVRITLTANGSSATGPVEYRFVVLDQQTSHMDAAARVRPRADHRLDAPGGRDLRRAALDPANRRHS